MLFYGKSGLLVKKSGLPPKLSTGKECDRGNRSSTQGLFCLLVAVVCGAKGRVCGAQKGECRVVVSLLFDSRVLVRACLVDLSTIFEPLPQVEKKPP